MRVGEREERGRGREREGEEGRGGKRYAGRAPLLSKEYIVFV